MIRFSDTFRISLAALLLTVVAACSPGGLSSDDRTAVAREVQGFLETWVEASDKGEFALMKPMYSGEPGFRWIENGRVAYDSAESAAAALDMAATAGYTADMDLRDPVITALSREAAAVTAEYTVAFDFGSGAQFTSEGVFTAVVVKEDGAWKFLQGQLSQPPADLEPSAVELTPQ